MSTISTISDIARGNNLGRQEAKIQKLHPRIRSFFHTFLQEAYRLNLDLQIFSDLRDYKAQEQLYTNYLKGVSNIPAAAPGTSAHELGFAIDTLVLDANTGKWTDTNMSLYKQLEGVANSYGIRWLGSVDPREKRHFDIFYPKYSNVFADLKRKNDVDTAGYINIGFLNPDKIQLKNSRVTTAVEPSTEIGQNNTVETNVTKLETTPEPPKFSTSFKEFKAVGIWQIVKLVSDQFSLSQNINDATIAYDQGSLLNFIKKVVQEPWLQFFGDTVGDQYFFQVRKEPFDLEGWRDGMTTKNISINDVLGDELSWYNGPVYSWYQINPVGTFLKDKDSLFLDIAAVFFEEYADIWGSKPLSVYSNYINFIKLDSYDLMLKKAFDDLRYMVESNCYLPFTRHGTITIKGDYIFRRGQKVTYAPTGEQFFIDGVGHSYGSTEQGSTMITTLTVSRGMVSRYLITPKSNNDVSYFNLILFDQTDDSDIKFDSEIPEQTAITYFDNDRSYLIDLNESFDGVDTVSKKMALQISLYPDLRKQLSDYNTKSIETAADLLKQYPDAPNISCVGYVDSDFGGKTNILAKKRAETLRSAIIQKYIQKYKDKTIDELNAKISISGAVNYVATNSQVADGGGGFIEQLNSASANLQLKNKATDRVAIFKIEKHTEQVTNKVKGGNINWRVNQPIFDFFLKRKQQNDCKNNDADFENRYLA